MWNFYIADTVYTVPTGGKPIFKYCGNIKKNNQISDMINLFIISDAVTINNPELVSIVYAGGAAAFKVNIDVPAMSSFELTLGILSEYDYNFPHIRPFSYDIDTMHRRCCFAEFVTNMSSVALKTVKFRNEIFHNS